MISVTHFMDRDGQMLADVAPRRYFCTTVPRAADRRATAGREHLRRHERAGRDAGERVGRCAYREVLRRFWTLISRPSRHLSLGFLTLGGFVGGVVFWGGFNTALEATNTETFCVSCHEMHDNVYQELKRTMHFANRSGVRATCPDCHVPHEWTDKIARKMQASKEVWGHIFGTIYTRQKFEEHRLELAKHEWARLKANDSLECRNCHSAPAMDFTRQSPRAQRIHARVPGHRRAHLHRLPQGDRARAAGHDRASNPAGPCRKICRARPATTETGALAAAPAAANSLATAQRARGFVLECSTTGSRRRPQIVRGGDALRGLSATRRSGTRPARSSRSGGEAPRPAPLSPWKYS